MKPQPGNKRIKVDLAQRQVPDEITSSARKRSILSAYSTSLANRSISWRLGTSFIHSFHESQPVRTVPTLLLRTSSRSMHVTITSPFLLPPPNLPLLCKVQSPSRAIPVTAVDKTSPYPDSYRSVQESVSVKNKSRKQKAKGSRTPSQHIPPLKTHPNQNPPLLKFLHHLSIQPLKLLKPPLKNFHINIPTR